MSEQFDEHCFIDCARHWWRIIKIHHGSDPWEPDWIIARCHDKPRVCGRINYDGRMLLHNTWRE